MPAWVSQVISANSSWIALYALSETWANTQSSSLAWKASVIPNDAWKKENESVVEWVNSI